jgi:acyl-coenzyme A thioesterase 9
MASVDCSTEKNEDLCSKLRVQAYPSVRVYRAGSLHPSKENQTSIVDLHRNTEDIQFEVYHGKRRAEAIAAFADSLLKEVEATLEDDTDETPSKKRHTVFGHDADGDGRHDSVVRTPGCSVNGQFNVNRVPGAFYFVPRSHSHSLADVDMTHVIRHLSFGDHVPGRPSFIPRHLRKAWSLVPADMGGRYAKKDNGGGGAQFDARENRQTAFEHYIKVIPRTFAPIDEAPIQIYEYTFSSNHFDILRSAEEREMIYYEDEHAIDEFRRPRGPVVKFSYDLSPMQVRKKSTQSRK